MGSGESHGTGHFSQFKSGQYHRTGHLNIYEMASPMGLATVSLEIWNIQLVSPILRLGFERSGQSHGTGHFLSKKGGQSLGQSRF